MKKHFFLTACLSLLFAVFVNASLTAQPGAALHFDGYDDRIGVQGLNLTGAFTIEVWVKPTEKSDFSTIISNKFGGYEMPGYSLAINNYASSDGKLVLETQLSSTISSASITWDVWQHLSVTYNGISEVKMYINGNEIGTDLAQISLAPSYIQTAIGDWGLYYGNGKYSGNMDELRVWNYARNANAIQAQMNCELTGNETGLIAYYNFNQGAAGADNAAITTLTDMAGADNNGSLFAFALNGMSSNWISPGFNSNQADSDCDGVGDACDICPGGDDRVDSNNDGKPDCKFPPARQSQLISAWKCGSDIRKVLICHKGATLCVAFSSLADHLSHGDYIGPCGSANCSDELIFKPSSSEKSSAVTNGLEIITFPNPTTNEFKLTAVSDQSNQLFITVKDVQGRTIYQKQGPPNQSFRFGSEFASGIYFIQVLQGSESLTSKLIKN